MDLVSDRRYNLTVLSELYVYVIVTKAVVEKKTFDAFPKLL